MITKIPSILTTQQIKEIRSQISKMEWVDGNATAGHQSIKVKQNLQLNGSDPQTQNLAMQILEIIQQNPLFVSASLPLKISPPMFNKYMNGGHYGTHVDSAIRAIPSTHHRLRTDLSATLFLSDPDEYAGGELTIEDANGSYQIKLPAGDMILYESGRMHDVSPVTEGERIACVFWVQSMVKSAENRSILLDLDISIQTITQKAGELSHAEIVRLTGVYHNLLRLWGDC